MVIVAQSYLREWSKFPVAVQQNLEVDHIIATSVGGTDHIGNLQLLCSNCNRIKGNRGQEYLLSRLNRWAEL
ncbi:HNH endonuclease [Candidatus Poribacteria bacterium]|nr:HNH endonuclease [Candidatus Poribacteria bacterium]